MKILNFLKKIGKNKDLYEVEAPIDEEAVTEVTAEAQTEEMDELEEDVNNEEVSLGTKIKVVSALFIVGFATYIAYWVQEPTSIKVDVLDSADTVAMEEIADDPFMEDDFVMESDTSTVMAMDSTSQEVAIIDFDFLPSDLTVGEGEQVVWTNMDAVEHTVTGDNFSSGPLSSGESYTYTFDMAGTYEYACSFHPQMKGTVTVEVAALSAELPIEELSAAAPEETEFAPAAAETSEDVTSLDAFLMETEMDIAADDTAMDPEGISVDAQEFLVDEALESQHMAADTELAETGPEDLLYGLVFLVILYMNRRRLFGASA